MSKIVFTGGGTAGHVMPNIALIGHLKDHELHYIGCPDSMEEALIAKHTPFVKFHALKAYKLTRGSILKNLTVPFKLCASKCEAKKLLAQIKPDVIFSKGGFVALPTTLASKNIPVILHESDFSFGLANKLALKRCAKICTSFKTLAGITKNAVHTGAPLRSSIYTGDSSVIENQFLDFKACRGGRKNLLIIGGSLGATAINNAVFNDIEPLTKRFNIVHIVGKNNKHKITHSNYHQISFADNIADFYAWANFCLTRGGANALFELVALKIPSLVIPLPKGVSRGDQVDNANYFSNLGCVHVLNQENLYTDENNNMRSPLVEKLDELVANEKSLKLACAEAKNIDGTAKLVEIIKQFI